MTNSDGGFQFDFQQPEKPVRPTVPPIPGKRRQHIAQNPRHKPHRLCSSRNLCRQHSRRSLHSPHSPHSLCSPRK